MSGVPLIDISPLLTHNDAAGRRRVSNALHAAAQDVGFFYVVGHGVDEALQEELVTLSQYFFTLPIEEKQRISMARFGGKAWRGYFAVGDELTHGIRDVKEGLYFGDDLPPDDPRVVRGLPYHGANLWPGNPRRLRPVVLEYMAAVVRLGYQLMEGFSIALGLPSNYMQDNLMDPEPLSLFRIFSYPPPTEEFEGSWGVGEHTDYGFLAILKQDDCGGLQVKRRDGTWVHAAPIPNTFVVNIGDMLEKMTGGLYRSTPHRVANVSGRHRISFPLFLGPRFDASMRRLPEASDHLAASTREDGLDGFTGTYGDWVVGKVAKVFPTIAAAPTARM